MNPRSRLWWTFAITSLALFAFTLDRLVVAIALPAIRAGLGAQVSGLEWTVNAYTLSFAVLLLTGSALGDRFGRRRMFTIGVAIFTAGSAAAALAPTLGTLVVARAVQGAGGALLVPLTLTMLSVVTPPERRGATLGAWGRGLDMRVRGVLPGRDRPGRRFSRGLGQRARARRPSGRARPGRRPYPDRDLRAPRPRGGGSGFRLPHGQFHDQGHCLVRATRLPLGAGVRLRHGRPLQPVRRRTGHVDHLPALPGPGARSRPGCPVRVTHFDFLEDPMTSNVRIRRVSSPAYYLARPAALWLAAFAPRPADRESCASESSPRSA